MARSFNGTSDKIISGAVLPSSVPSALTVSFWIKPNANAGSAVTSVPHAITDGTVFACYSHWDNTSAGNEHEVAAEDAGLNFLAASMGTGTGGAWFHMAATVTSVVTPYLNGVAQSPSLSLTGGIKWNASLLAYLAVNVSTQFWAGALADFALWSVALSGANLTALASGQRADHVHPSNMLVYYPILGGSPELDKSGNGNNGTVTGTTVVADPGTLEAWAASYSAGSLDSLTQASALTSATVLAGANLSLTNPLIVQNLAR